MRIVTFRSIREASGGPRGLGALLGTAGDGSGGRVLPLGALPELDVVPGIGKALGAADLVALLLADPDLATTRAAVARAGDATAGSGGGRDRHGVTSSFLVDRASVRLLAPLPRPGKIVCVGLNYRDHVEEQHIDTPSRPTLFAKFANAIVGDGDAVIRHDATRALDLEAELGVVIGRRAHRVPVDGALRHVAGYLTANDVSARDLQGQKAALAPGERGDGQWLRAKGSDTFLPLGPALVTADEVPDPGHLAVRSWRTPASGGAGAAPIPMQTGNTSDMLWPVPELIAFISAVITLEPGDLIVTGTPAGVGVFRDPPVFLVPGDVASVEVEGLGRLDNPIVAADGSVPPASPAEALLRRHELHAI